VLLVLFAFIAHRGDALAPTSRIQTGVGSFLPYFPAVFIIEEVSFRGLLDAHLHRPEEPRGIVSAISASALWGLWHYPIVSSGARLSSIVPQLLMVHVLIGVPLSRA